MTVLVVHRGGQAVAWLRTRLRRAGLRVVAAADGPVGQEIAHLEEPTLVLLRLTCPSTQQCAHGDMDGPGMAAAADALGLTSDEMPTQPKGNRSLADLISSTHVDLQSPRDAEDAMNRAAIQDAIAQAVKGGHLTQETANWLLVGMEVGVASGR